MLGKGFAKLEAELNTKSEKITELQDYLEKCSGRFRQLDTENATLKKENEIFRKTTAASQTVIQVVEARVIGGRGRN